MRTRMVSWVGARGLAAGLVALVFGTPPALAAALPQTAAASKGDRKPADRIASGLRDAALRALVTEVLERNPEVAAATAGAQAARLRAPQAKSLPDPMLGATTYVEPPETRVGPQRVMATLSQRLPWFGKLSLKEEAALARADAQDAEVQAHRLALVTETRRLYYEIGFLDAYVKVVHTDRDTLIHYEELARARYASGVGLEQAVIKIQAEITKDDNRLLDLRTRRATLVARLNALRDRPQDSGVPPLALPRLPSVDLDPVQLRKQALELRPELAGAEAQIAAADRMVDLARKQYKPDLTVGLLYAWVGPRGDPAGRLQPPPDNADDVFGVQLGVNLPFHRKRLKAGVEEAADRRLSAVERKRVVTTSIDQALGELVERVRLTSDQVHLYENVLGIQAEQSLRSAEAAYSAGTLNSLDLLDAERVLLDVRTGAERARADYAIALARLEGAVGERLISTNTAE